MRSTASEPRIPREFTEDPEGFGRVQTLRWKRVATLELQVPLLASKWQHAYAFRIRGRIKATGSNLKTYARDAGTSYDRLGKLLRGVVPMRLDDIAVADILLGEISEITD